MRNTTTALLLLGAFTTACGDKVTVPEEFSTLVIMAETTGDTLDADGYSVQVAGEVVEVPATGSVTIDGLERGTVTADVSGVSVNCALEGEPTRSLTLGEDSEELRISVFCLPALLGRVVFDSDQDGDHEIYVMNPDGSDQVQLTNNDDRDEFPAVSPDGTMIAFMRYSAQDSHIYTMRADGTGTTRITEATGPPHFRAMPTWSPDGSRIAYNRHASGESSDLYLMDPDGSNRVQLTSTEGSDLFPSWARDGAGLVFASFVEGRHQLHSINADGTGLRRLTDHEGADLYPSWSPSGDLLVFSRQMGSAYHLFTMSPDGSDLTQLTSGDARDAAASWSPDGRSILFSSDRSGSWELYSMDLTSGEISASLTPAGSRNFWPRWSPPR